MFSDNQTSSRVQALLICRSTCKTIRNVAGIGILEVLISMAILSLATIALLKATSSALASSIDNRERHQMTLMGTDLLNVLAAHVASMDSKAPRSEIRSRIETISDMIERQANTMMKSKGYDCRHGKIQQTQPSGHAIQTKSTLLKYWIDGPPVCVLFTIEQHTANHQTNGVWVQIQLSRLSLTQENAGPESIVISSLIEPF